MSASSGPHLEAAGGITRMGRRALGTLSSPLSRERGEILNGCLLRLKGYFRSP
jgi:hypothetical protein